MARPLRIEFPGAVYHVMNRGTARQRVFCAPADYESFLKVVGDCHALWGVEVLAYCLMSNHYHLCLRTPQGNLARVMRHLDGLYTQRFNRAHERDGPLFRGRYKAIVVDADAYLAAVIRYIHLNPVAAKLMKRPDGYRWSSHGAYLRTRPAPRWLNVKEILEEFPNRQAFQAFVLAGNEEALEAFYGAGRQASVLGREGFRQRLLQRVRRLSREHPRHERRAVRPALEQVLARVARGYGVKVSEVQQGRRGLANEARKVAMYLVTRLCDLTLAETAARFGGVSYGTVAWACHQVRTRAASDRHFQRQLQRIQSHVNQPKT